MTPPPTASVLSKSRGGGLLDSFPSSVSLGLGAQRLQRLTVELGGFFGAGLAIPAPRSYGELERKYGTSAWVYICVRKKARDLAAAPFVAYQIGDADRAADDAPLPASHPLRALLRQPNPWMTMGVLLQHTVAYLELTGNAFWFVGRDRARRPRAILPINPMAVIIHEGTTRPVSHCEVWSAGQSFDLLPFDAGGRPGDILHFKYPSPLSIGDSALPSPWGMGPLEPAWTLVVTDEDAVRWNRNIVRNDGRPAGVLSSDQPVTQDEADEAAERFYRTFSGPEAAGRVLVLGRGLTYTRTSVTPKDFDYVNSRGALREEIIGMFGLNSAVLGLAQGDVGRRSEAHREYYQSTIVAMSSSDIAPVVSLLGAEWGDDIVVRQDFSKVKALEEDADRMTAIAYRVWGMGVGFNKVNRRYNLGFDDVEGGDVGLLPLSLAPAPAVAAGAALPPAAPEEGPLGAAPFGAPGAAETPPPGDGEDGGPPSSPPGGDEESDAEKAVRGLNWLAAMARGELARRVRARAAARRGEPP